ncbi:MAG: 2-phosphosulfolactate phosphatase [Methanobacteriota archaeon]
MIEVDVRWGDEVSENHFKSRGRELVVIVDTLRATSTISVALSCGASSVTVLSDLTRSFKLKASHPHAILAGERSGVKICDFDVGNSPFKIKGMLTGSDDLASELILNTSNFSRVLEEVSVLTSQPVIAASLVNSTRISKFILDNEGMLDGLFFVPVGTYLMGGQELERPKRFCEDCLAVFHVIEKLTDGGCDLDFMDGARNCKVESKYKGSLSNDLAVVDYLWKTEYVTYLLELDSSSGVDENRRDIEVCFNVDSHPTVPLLFRNKSLLSFKESPDTL